MDTVLRIASAHGRKLLLLAAALAHLAVIALVTFRLPTERNAETERADVFKMVDVTELIPPKPVAPIAPENTIDVPIQAQAASTVVETDKVVVETATAAPYVAEEVIQYLPQHKISRIPVIPTDQILAKARYPELAAKMGLEGIVYLELYVDKTGRIRNIVVIKDPGHGFAEAALKAMEGIACLPAEANGQPVAVKFRYPVRFALKR